MILSLNQTIKGLTNIFSNSSKKILLYENPASSSGEIRFFDFILKYFFNPYLNIKNTSNSKIDVEGV